VSDLPVLRVEELNIEEETGGLLSRKELGSYPAVTVFDCARHMLKKILGEHVTVPARATWNARKGFWEGAVRVDSSLYRWTIDEGI
jgi:hypothetical protein